MQVRAATPDDVGRLLPLVRAYWDFEGIGHFHEAAVGRQLERLLTQPRLGAGWIALDDGGAAGYLLAVYVFSLEHLGLTAEIDEFFVAKEHRSGGVGTGLLRAAEAGFALAGCTNVSLQLARGNPGARTFYRRHGYSERAGYELMDKTLVSARP